MNAAVASDLFRSALWIAIEVGGPLLGFMTLVAVVAGILQAATQVQDSSVSFTPKVAAAVGAIWFASTWMVSMLESFMHEALSAIPWIIRR